MKKKFDRACPICSSAQEGILYAQNFIVPDKFPLTGSKAGKISQNIVACHNCGFVFAVANLFQKDYNRYYAKYDKYSCVCSQNSDFEIDGFNQYIINFIESICGSDKRKKIVDIGCGSGKFLFDLKSKGFTELYGIDITPTAAGLFKQSGIKYKTGNITEKNIDFAEPASFDIVCLISVLEHIYDLNIALSNISMMLKKNAFVIILVPDAAYYCKELTNPLHQINLEHINHFDKISLDNLMRRHGFSPYISGRYVVDTQKISSTQMLNVYKKRNVAADEKKIVFAAKASNSIIILVKKWKKRKVDKELKRILSSQEEVVVYGAGNYTYNLLSDTILRNCNIVAFIDGNPNKQRACLMGLPVCGPDFLLGFKGTIIISVAYEPQLIAQQIIDKGLKNKIYVL